MKKLLLILILSISFISCATAQKVKQEPIYKTNAYVQRVDKDITILQPTDSRVSYEVATDSTMELYKEYVFWMEIMDCHKCRTKKAVVLGKAFTTAQAQRDQEKEAERLSNKTIIKL